MAFKNVAWRNTPNNAYILANNVDYKLLIVYYTDRCINFQGTCWVFSTSSTISHATEDTICVDSVVKTAASHKAQLITAIRLRLRQPINPIHSVNELRVSDTHTHRCAGKHLVICDTPLLIRLQIMGIWNMIGVSRGRLITTSNWFELCGGDVGAGCDILVPSELRLGNFLTQILKRIPRGERCSLKCAQHSEPPLRVPICKCDLERKCQNL